MEEIGQYLRRIRQDRGIGVRELAKKVGISHSYLSQIETGHKKDIKQYVLRALVQDLSIDCEDLFNKTGYDLMFFKTFDEHIGKEKLEELSLEAKLLETNIEAFNNNIEQPIFVDKDNNVNIQIYKENKYLNENDTKSLNQMIKGFLFDKEFIHTDKNE